MENSEKSNLWRYRKKNIIGVLFFAAVFCSGFFIHGNTGMYLNLSGFIIVLGGTLCAALLSYPAERLAIVFKVLSASYGKPVRSPDSIINILVDLSVKQRVRGILSLQDEEEETTIVFLRQAIGLLVDDYSKDELRESLNAEMYFFRMRRDETIRVLQTMADVAPAFGLVGSVVGLISMLSGVGNSAVIMATVPIALTSTLYGIILANLFFIPFASNIRERTVQELMLQKIITEGVAAIAEDLHPRELDRKLKSYLTPAARNEEVISLAKLKEKFESKESKALEEAEEPT
ncbi:MAG: MotA/TolQ/ExbB proton channel family protein [Desulfobacteraceae bacterium]